MALSDALNIPGLGGYLAQRQFNDQANLGQLHQADSALGILAQQHAMQQEGEIKRVLSAPGTPDEKMQALTALGPKGVQIAQLYGQSQATRVKAAEDARKAAFFSPENRAKYMTPTETAPAIANDDNGNPNPGVAGAPTLDFNKYLQDAAAQGVVNPEVYANHQAAIEQRKAATEATAQARKDALQARLMEIETRSQDRQASLEQRAADQAAARELRRELVNLSLSNRPQKQIQLTTDAEGNQLIVQPDGTTRPLTTQDGAGVMKPTKADRPMTEFQGKASLYGTRAAQSDKILKSIEDKISRTGFAIKQAVPGGNFVMGADEQRVDQAQRDFVNAVLRQESGAVISDAEFANAKKQYFPAPGDKPENIAQKRRNREIAIEGFSRMAGPKGAVDIKAIADEPLLPSAPASNDGWSIKPKGQ